MWTPATPCVFCTVTAVTALAPNTPRAAKVFRSAWMPAPPPESEPAIVSTRGTCGGHMLRLFRPKQGLPCPMQYLLWPSSSASLAAAAPASSPSYEEFPRTMEMAFAEL